MEITNTGIDGARPTGRGRWRACGFNPNQILALLELLSGLGLAALVLSLFFARSQDLSEFGLGDRTATYQARSGPYLIHVIKNCDEEENSLMAGWRARGERPVCLILGYSQAHSINEMQSGQVNYAQILFERHTNDARPFDVLCQSLPNANMSEYYALFAYWDQKLPVKALAVPACMDKMRNDGLRQEYLQNLGFSGFQITNGSDEVTVALNRMLSEFPKSRTDSKSTDNSDPDNAALKETVQERTEHVLNAWLAGHLPAWSHRPTVRGEVFQWLYLLRNSALGISSNTKRKTIPAHYARNMQSLEALLRKAQREHIAVLIYVPPIRFDIATPYDDREYAQFKEEVQALVEKYATVARYLNLEGIVPGPCWGDLPPTDLSGKRQPDFMHFKYEGHKLTADALDPVLSQMMAR